MWTAFTFRAKPSQPNVCVFQWPTSAGDDRFPENLFRKGVNGTRRRLTKRNLTQSRENTIEWLHDDEEFLCKRKCVNWRHDSQITINTWVARLEPLCHVYAPQLIYNSLLPSMHSVMPFRLSRQQVRPQTCLFRCFGLFTFHSTYIKFMLIVKSLLPDEYWWISRIWLFLQDKDVWYFWGWVRSSFQFLWC